MKLSSRWGLDKSIEFCRRPQKVDKILSTFRMQILSKNVVIPPSTDCGYSSQTKKLIISNEQFMVFVNLLIFGT